MVRTSTRGLNRPRQGLDVGAVEAAYDEDGRYDGGRRALSRRRERLGSSSSIRDIDAVWQALLVASSDWPRVRSRQTGHRAGRGVYRPHCLAVLLPRRPCSHPTLMAVECRPATAPGRGPRGQHPGFDDETVAQAPPIY